MALVVGALLPLPRWLDGACAPDSYAYVGGVAKDQACKHDCWGCGHSLEYHLVWPNFAHTIRKQMAMCQK